MGANASLSIANVKSKIDAEGLVTDAETAEALRLLLEDLIGRVKDSDK